MLGHTILYVIEPICSRENFLCRVFAYILWFDYQPGKCSGSKITNKIFDLPVILKDYPMSKPEYNEPVTDSTEKEIN